MRKQITVIGLGPGGAEQLTQEALAAMRAAGLLILRTGRHPVREYLEEKELAFETLDRYYDCFEDFGQMHKAMAEELWKRASSPLVFCVPDLATDEAVKELCRIKPERASLTLIPGVSIAQTCAARLGGLLDASAGYAVVPAYSLSEKAFASGMPLLITEIDNPRLAGDVKLALSSAIGDETEVILLPSLLSTAGKPKRIPACETDRQRHYDHTVCLYVPPLPLLSRTRYGISDVVDLVEVLRSPDGCPWDRTQTHATIRKHLIEEAYEAADAIDRSDDESLFDELGDLLFHIVFHASIGRQEGCFDLADVTSAVCRKMICRHPKLFPPREEGEDGSTDLSWEDGKKREKGFRSQGEALKDVPHALPALIRAAKVQARAAQVGFDWDSAEGAFPKILEEAEEVRAELKGGSGLREELGDLLFSCVNVSRLAGIDPEQALTFATEKFIRRFDDMEKRIISDGKALKSLTLAEMDVYWSQVK